MGLSGFEPLTSSFSEAKYIFCLSFFLKSLPEAGVLAKLNYSPTQTYENSAKKKFSISAMLLNRKIL